MFLFLSLIQQVRFHVDLGVENYIFYFHSFTIKFNIFGFKTNISQMPESRKYDNGFF